mgnify:CR=1 FL=1
MTNMKGILHKTKHGGWQVWYHAKEDLFYGNTGVRILPILDHGYVNGPGLSDSDEGQEVEFEIIKYPNPPHNPTYHSIDVAAKLVDKATRPLTEDDAWPNYPTKAQQLHIQIAEECFRKYPNNEELYPTDDLKDAYKAGVIDGLKEWTLDSYNPPTKKQDNE